jgi:uracil-DNA glycosylase
MFKEIATQTGNRPDNTSLTGWAGQGVLLLNTVLTVEARQANSHRMMGWERFTDRVIAALGQRDQPTVFLLWGSAARSKKRYITNKNHLILESAHPSPLSAYRGFFGNKHFVETNNWLLRRGETPIDWQKSGDE